MFGRSVKEFSQKNREHTCLRLRYPQAFVYKDAMRIARSCGGRALRPCGSSSIELIGDRLIRFRTLRALRYRAHAATLRFLFRMRRSSVWSSMGIRLGTAISMLQCPTAPTDRPDHAEPSARLARPFRPTGLTAPIDRSDRRDRTNRPSRSTRPIDTSASVDPINRTEQVVDRRLTQAWQ